MDELKITNYSTVNDLKGSNAFISSLFSPSEPFIKIQPLCNSLSQFSGQYIHFLSYSKKITWVEKILLYVSYTEHFKSWQFNSVFVLWKVALFFLPASFCKTAVGEIVTLTVTSCYLKTWKYGGGSWSDGIGQLRFPWDRCFWILSHEFLPGPFKYSHEI